MPCFQVSYPVGLLLALCIAQSAPAEWYLAAYGGSAAARPADIRVDQSASRTQLTFTGVQFEGRSFDSPFYYGYRAGAFASRWLGVEAEFIHAKIHARIEREVHVRGLLAGRQIDERAPLARYARKLDESHGLNLVLGNAVLRRQFDRVALLGRLGVGFTVPHPETDVLSGTREDYQPGGPCGQAAGGLELRVWRGLHLFGEYKRTWTRQTIELAAGEARMSVHMNHIATGVAVHF